MYSKLRVLDFWCASCMVCMMVYNFRHTFQYLSHLKSVAILTSDRSSLKCLHFYAFAKNVWHIGKKIEESGALSGTSHQPAILKLELQRLYLNPDSRELSLPQLLLDIYVQMSALTRRDTVFALLLDGSRCCQ